MAKQRYITTASGALRTALANHVQTDIPEGSKVTIEVPDDPAELILRLRSSGVLSGLIRFCEERGWDGTADTLREIRDL